MGFSTASLCVVVFSVLFHTIYTVHSYTISYTPFVVLSLYFSAFTWYTTFTMKVVKGEYPVSPLYPIPAAHALFIYKDRPIALFPLAWLSAPEATRFRPMRVELVARWMARFGISDVYEINEYPTKLRVPYILYLDLVRKSGVVQLWYGNPVQELGSPYTHYIGPFVSRAEADHISEFYNFYGRIRRRNEDLSSNVIQGSEEVDRQSPG